MTANPHQSDAEPNEGAIPPPDAPPPQEPPEEQHPPAGFEYGVTGGGRPDPVAAPAPVSYHFHSYSGAQVAGDVLGALNIDDNEETRSAGPAVVSVTSGSVWSQETRDAIAVFVRPDWYDRALRLLHERGVVLLEGSEHSGRRTAALSLLDEQHAGSITAFEPDVDLAAALPTALEDRHGYLVDSMFGSRVRELSEVRLSHLATLLRKHRAHLVITVPSGELRREIRDGYAVRADPPDLMTVLRNHLTDRLGAEQFAAHHEELLGPRIQKFLTGEQEPGRVAELARELAESVDYGYPVTHALDAWRDLAAQEAPKLFASCPSPEERAMLLAVAVFEGCDYEIVASAAHRLWELAGSELVGSEPSTEPATPAAAATGQEPRRLFGRTRTARLEKITAHELPPIVDDRGSCRYRLRRVRFRRLHMAEALLRHVWCEHEGARARLLEWLATTPARRSLHLHAAGAAGRLVAQTSGYDVMQPLLGWAGSEEHKLRVMAAEALGTAAENRVVGTQVRERLRRWERAAGWRPRQAAAIAYGQRFGLGRPQLALGGLERIAKHRSDEHDRVQDTVVRSMAVLSDAAGTRPVVLQRLLAWTDDPGSPLYATGLQAFLRILRQDTTNGRPELPVWARQESEAGVLATLLRRGLSDPATYGGTRDLFFGWRSAARGHPDIMTAVDELVADVLRDPHGGGVLELATELEQYELDNEMTDSQLVERARSVQDTWLFDVVLGQGEVHDE